MGKNRKKQKNKAKVKNKKAEEFIPEQKRQSDDEEDQDESDGCNGVNPQLHSSVCATSKKNNNRTTIKRQPNAHVK